MKYWTFWKGPSLNAGPSGKFLIVDHPKEDHNERMFKHVRLKSESWTYWKSPVKKRIIHISGSQLNIIASTLELLKIFSEVIVASKCVLLAKIEKQAMSWKLDLLKSFFKVRYAEKVLYQTCRKLSSLIEN